MSKVTFKLNRAGVASLMKSNEMQAILQGHASKMVRQLGTGYSHDIYVGKNRANSRVRADSKKAQRDNLRNNSLLKAVR